MMLCFKKVYNSKQNKFLFYIISLATLSLSIFLMPFVNGIERDTPVPMYIVGVLFWVAVVFTVRMAIKINKDRLSDSDFNRKHKGVKKLAVIHFFQNKEAMIIDVTMLVSLIAFLVVCFLTNSLILQFLFVSMFAFSFGMHCMLNGINYIYIKTQLNS